MYLLGRAIGTEKPQVLNEIAASNASRTHRAWAKVNEVASRGVPHTGLYVGDGVTTREIQRWLQVGDLGLVSATASDVVGDIYRLYFG